MWEMYPENIGTGEFVAKYLNAKGFEAFKVMEANGEYFTMPNYSFIVRRTVSKDEVMSYCANDSQKKDEKFLLHLACALIGRDYRSQPSVIEKDFI